MAQIRTSAPAVLALLSLAYQTKLAVMIEIRGYQ
jgi:hypothetical protein